MPKIIDARIAYYTRKLAEWSATYRTHEPGRRSRRHKRLLAYKAMMREQIREEGFEWSFQ